MNRLGLEKMVKKIIKTNLALRRSFLGILIYALLAVIIPQDILIEAFNGLFLGMVAAIALVFRKVFLKTLLHKGPYARVDQFALSLMYLWLALILFRLTSVWNRASTPETILDQFDNVTVGLALATAIAAGTMMITSPGWDSKYLHERDRITMYLSLIAGLAISFTIFFAQRYKVLTLVQEYLAYHWSIYV